MFILSQNSKACSWSCVCTSYDLPSLRKHSTALTTCNYKALQRNLVKHLDKSILCHSLRHSTSKGNLCIKLCTTKNIEEMQNFLLPDYSEHCADNGISGFICIRDISDIFTENSVASPGMCTWIGYWTGPDVDDGWGYVKAAVLQIPC